MNRRNTRRRISGTNGYKEHLRFNEKKRNVKNIDLFFLTLANFSTHAKILWTRSTHAIHMKILIHAIFFDSRQNFMNSHHPCHLRQNLTQDTHEPMHPRYPRHPRYPCHPRCFADSIFTHYFAQIFTHVLPFKLE